MNSAGGDGIAATNTDLLLALRDGGNDRAWTAFCARYQPVIISFARRLGLSEQDAQDAAQESLFAFANAYRQGEYNRARGRLHSWLFSIAGHKIRDLQRHNHRHPAATEPQSGTGWIEKLPDAHDLSDVWESQWQRAMLEVCLAEVDRQLEPSTVQAFRMYALEDRDPDEVGAQLNMTRNAVFKAQRRVLTHLRETYEKLLNDEG